MNFFAYTCLNISFFLYIFYYLPQLWHNFNRDAIQGLSFGFHTLLLVAAIADLYYAFVLIQQWQYRVVSIIFFACLLCQHLQLYFYVDARQIRWRLHGLSLCIMLFLCVLILSQRLNYSSLPVAVAMGWVERTCNMLFVLPQLYKNKKLQTAASISRYYLSLTAVVTICDIVSAWYFHWGPSSRYGAPLTLLFVGLLIYQSYRYRAGDLLVEVGGAHA